MIGIILADNDEITTLKDIDKNMKVYQSPFFKYYLFSKKNNDFVLVFSGIGKANSSACCLELIKVFSVDSLLNFGSCCSITNNLKLNDVLILDKNYYLDVDLSFLKKYEVGQIPNEPSCYENNNSLVIRIKTIFEYNNIIYSIVNGATSDSFINYRNINNFHEQILSKVKCIEMEATSIKQIAYKAKIDTCFVKVVSDYVFNKVNEFEFNKNNWSNKITQLINIIINNI